MAKPSFSLLRERIDDRLDPLAEEVDVPPADDLAAVGNCHPRERDLVALRRLRPARERQPLHADVLLRDRPVIGDVIAQLFKKRRVGVGADGDRPVRVLIDLNGVADDVLLVFYIVLIGRNRLRVQRLTRGRGIAGASRSPQPDRARTSASAAQASRRRFIIFTGITSSVSLQAIYEHFHLLRGRKKCGILS